MQKHYHYEFIAYDKGNKLENKTTSIEFPVNVSIQDASSEADALKRVKQMVKRKKYYLSKSWECSQCFDEQDKTRQEALQMTQLKLMAKAVEGIS